MMRVRIQVEEMHVYYFIAKKLISGAKLGFMGVMTSPEEKLINSIYNSDNLDEISELSKKLFDKLDKEQTELKINTNPYSFKDTEELISEALSYTTNLLFKPEVLENVKKALKADLSTHDKILLCVENIAQTKRVLAGLSPEEKKQILDGKGIEVTKRKSKKSKSIKAVDEENVSNVTDVEVGNVIDVNDVPLDEEVVEAIDDDVDEGNKLKTAFTVEDIPTQPIENIVVNGSEDENKQSSIDKKLEELEEEAEVLDFDEEEEQVVEEVTPVEEVVEDTVIEESVSTECEDVPTEKDFVEVDETVETVSVEEVVTEETIQEVESIEENISGETINDEIQEPVREVVEEIPVGEVVMEVTVQEEVSSEGEGANQEISTQEVVEENVQSIEEVQENNETIVPVAPDVVEPSPLVERVGHHDIGFMPEEPAIVVPAEEVIEEKVEEAVTYDVPEIFKIIERDGVVVDEEV